MTDMPERIWAFDFWEGNIPRAGDWTDERSEAPEGAVEYVRADLIPAALAVMALVEAVERERNVQPYDVVAQEEAADAVDRALAALRGEGRE